MKKTIAMLLAALLLITVGCTRTPGPSPSSTPNDPLDGPPTTPENGNATPVTIDILQYNVEIVEALNNAINLYTSTVAPNVTIRLKTVEDGTNMHAMLQDAITRNDMPDIFNAAGPSDMEQYQAYLEDLSDQPWAKTIRSDMLSGDMVDGNVYGLPVGVEAFGLVANAAIFSDAGIAIDDIKSFEELSNAFATLQAKIDDGSLKNKWPLLTHVVSIQGADAKLLGEQAANVALSAEFTGDVSAAAKAPRPAFTYGDALKAYLDLQIQYSPHKGNPAGACDIGYAEAVLGDLTLGRCAVVAQGNGIYKDVRDLDDNIAQALVFLPIPVQGYQEGSIFTTIPNYWVVNKTSPDAEKQAAKEFLNWLYTSEEGKNLVVKQMGLVPALENYGNLAPGNPLSKSLVQYLNKGRTIASVTMGLPELWAQAHLGENIQAYWRGELKFDQVLEKAAEQWEQLRKAGSKTQSGTGVQPGNRPGNSSGGNNNTGVSGGNTGTNTNDITGTGIDTSQ